MSRSERRAMVVRAHPALSLSRQCRLLCQGSPNNPHLGGVRPCGWTGSGRSFDRVPGVLILELNGAQIS